MRIIIIGAGVAGLSLGWRLAQGGAMVTVLERAQPARAATYAAAGMIAATAETGGTPEAEAELARQAQALWPDFAAEIEAVSGVSIAYRRDGALIAAATVEEAADLSRRAEAACTQFLSPAEARARAPMLAENIAGALWAPNEGQVDNRALGQALWRAAVKAGVSVEATEAAVRVERRPAGLLGVLTPFRLYEGDVVVVAAGAWSASIGGLVDAREIPVRPVKGEMIALMPPDPASLPQPLLWGHGIYLVPRGDRLLVGATMAEAGFDTRPTAAARQWLLERAARLLPVAAGWDLAEHWAGLRPAAPDGMPIAGACAEPGLFVLSGQYRNGILFAPALMEALAPLILGQTASLNVAAFSPQRFRR